MALLISPPTQPGGSNTQIQFNDNGGFGGDADLTYDKSTNTLTNKGDINLDDGGSFQTVLQLVTPTANRTITFPDRTGTVALVGGSGGQIIYNLNGYYAGVSTMTFDGTSVTLAGRMINSYTSLASSPAKIFTGTWFTNGTATTTKPHLLVEPSGATSTAWSTSGTGIGVNAFSGFAGRLLDLQLNGSSRFFVSSAGTPQFVGNIVLDGGSFSTSLTKTSPTANRTQTIQDRSGTLMLTDTSAVSGSTAINNVIRVTQSQYDGIGVPDANTLYVIVP